ncbi:unnamed protein product [Prunus armeniaca]
MALHQDWHGHTRKTPLIAQITGVPENGGIQVGQSGGALPIQEHEAPVWPEVLATVRAQQNQPEPTPIPQPMAPRDQPLALLPEAPVVLLKISWTSPEEWILIQTMVFKAMGKFTLPSHEQT